MKKVASTLSPLVTVDRHAAKPLHRQIYDAYRAAIVTRHVFAGQQVLSSRELASELRISRVPVLHAYAQLLAEGYFESRTGAGTFVSRSLPEQMTACETAGAVSAGSQTGRRSTSRRSALLPEFTPLPWFFGRGAFTVGQVATDHFPFREWSKLVARYWRNIRAASLHFSDPMGSEDFRFTLAKYLRTVRAVNCEAHQIMIVSGSQQALEISARVLLDPGDPVWLEDPGYPLARQVFAFAGCRVIPVPVDEDGLDVTAGMKRCRKAKAAYVTPSHQYPLGVTMSAPRRFQLLEWAANAHAWIIEDDYDSEYRYKDMPISSLQGLDRSARVIYIGTFSKTLFPSLRLGYVVIPPDLIPRFLAVRQTMDIYPAHWCQAVLREFIKEGHFARHIRRTRLLYNERRSALVEAIGNEFGSKFEVLGVEAGMHLVATTRTGLNDRKVSWLAAGQGLWLWPLSPCYLESASRQGFILGFGSTSARVIPQAVRQLQKVLTAR